MLSRKFRAVGIILLLVSAANVPQAMGGLPLILRVDLNAPGIVLDGMGWSTAFTRLEDAIAVASPGTEIRVAKGTYRPDNGTGIRTLSFEFHTGVVIRGGYAGYGMSNPNLRDPVAFPTILSGDIGIPGESSDNSFHVVSALGSGVGSVLSGVTIRDGHSSGGFPNNRGGGVTILSGAHRFEDCKFTLNYAQVGGALDIGNNASPVFVNCLFTSNFSTSNGGAVSTSGAFPTCVNCSFLDNSADLSGGAVAVGGGEMFLIDCNFSNNASSIFGGGVYISSGMTTLLRCVLSNNYMLNNLNVVYDGGGGLYNHSGVVLVYDSTISNNVTGDDGAGLMNRNGSTLLERCIVRGNWSADRGGAVYSFGGDLELRSCSLHANVAAFNAGGLFLTDCDSTVTRCTLAGNRSNGFAGGIQNSGGALAVRNSIFWGNFDSTGTAEPAQLRWLSGDVSVNYTCMMGWTGFFGGVGNLSLNPLFVNVDGPDGVAGTADDDMRLLSPSPCINAGDPELTSPPEMLDLSGNPRIMGCRIDMGAFEFVTGPANSGDMDASGTIDGLDIQGFTQALLGVGPPAYQCVADLNADTLVNELDLVIFLPMLLAE